MRYDLSGRNNEGATGEILEVVGTEIPSQNFAVKTEGILLIYSSPKVLF